MLNVSITFMCIVAMIYYKNNYQHKIGYIPFHLPTEDEPLKWYEDYLSVQWRIIRYVFTAIMLGLVAYFILYKRGNL